MSRARDVIDRIAGKAPPNAKRSSKWPKVRDEFLRGKVCECCGGKVKLIAHHRIPFHLAPDMELDPENLIALCEAAKFGLNCHLLLGHLGDWSQWNQSVQADVAYWHARLLE